jgi:hypothetical protein
MQYCFITPQTSKEKTWLIFLIVRFFSIHFLGCYFLLALSAQTMASSSTCRFSRAAQLGSVHTLQADACFHHLFPSCAYSVEVRADAAAEAKHDACTARRAALKEREERDGAKRPGAKAGVDRITQQLKGMSAEERTGMGSEEFRALKEARDLEDILFS